jgi:DNA-binding XRE family transcriptional regulator
MNTFRDNLIRLRGERKLSQYELAAALGVRQSAIGNIEAGKRKPSWELADRIASYFGLTLAEMVTPAEKAKARELCNN